MAENLLPSPSVGRIVHYVSEPGGEYLSTCRAAVITSIVDAGDHNVSLCVFELNGTLNVPHSEPSAEKDRGTWHWPERA